MLRTDLITIKNRCQGVNIHPFILVSRTQAKHVFPNFVSVRLYIFKFSILKQINEKPVFLNFSQRNISEKFLHLLFQIQRVKYFDPLPYLLIIIIYIYYSNITIFKRQEDNDLVLNHCIHLLIS